MTRSILALPVVFIFLFSNILHARSLSEALGAADIAIPDSNCFWVGPYVKENPVTNIAYPDTGAKYWSTRFVMPPGSKLEFYGRYMHNRYMSFNSYDVAGDNPSFAPVDALRGAKIKPLYRFIKNPYKKGKRRDAFFRGYKIEVLPGAPQEGDANNTLRSNAAYGQRASIILRSYVEDEGTGPTAGEFLPWPILTLADGTVLSEIDEVCAAADVDPSYVQVPLIPSATYDQMTAFGNPYARGINATAETPAYLYKAFTFSESINCSWFGDCADNPVNNVGFYANLDNQYVSGFVNHYRPKRLPETALGLPQGTTPLGEVTVGYDKDEQLEVAVFRGRLPKTPKTRDGQRRVKGKVNMRYWSFCTNQYMSQKVNDCIYDEDLIVDDKGFYTIALSLAEDRPANAIAECGVNWLESKEIGDGYLEILQQQVANGQLGAEELTKPNAIGQPRANVPSQSLVIVRNMLPAKRFKYAIQNVNSALKTAEVMGDYAVAYHYESTAEFESRACH